MVMEDKIKMYLHDSEMRELFKRIIEYTDKMHEKYPDATMWDEFEWHDVGAPPHILRKLVVDGILEVRMKTNKHTYYAFKDRDLVKRLLEEYEQYANIEDTSVVPQQEEEIPDDLFDTIVGMDDVKELMHMIIHSEQPVHCLLHGPPASAKTVILLEIARLKGAFYVLGGSTTKVGLTEQLIELKPRYVLIDEIDKMRKEDYTALLSLCETGIVKVVKHNMAIEEKLNARVFAACNNLNSLPPEVVSRFMVISLPQLSKEDFVKVATEVLVKREGKDRELAEYIASRVAEIRMDVREAVRIARLCTNKEQVDKVINILKKYTTEVPQWQR